MTRSLALLTKVANGLIVTAITLCLPTAFAQSAAGAAQTGTIRVDAKRIINSFDPDAALGSSIDVLSRIDINSVFTPHILQESLSAGWGPITYRNNTELRVILRNERGLASLYSVVPRSRIGHNLPRDHHGQGGSFADKASRLSICRVSPRQSSRRLVHFH